MVNNANFINFGFNNSEHFENKSLSDSQLIITIAMIPIIILIMFTIYSAFFNNPQPRTQTQYDTIPKQSSNHLEQNIKQIISVPIADQMSDQITEISPMSDVLPQSSDDFLKTSKLVEVI